MKTYKKPTLSIHNDIITLSEFKTQASKILSSINKTGRSVVITQNGKPSGVVISTAEFDWLREQLQFYAAIEKGREDIQKGRSYRTEEIEAELDRSFGKVK